MPVRAPRIGQGWGGGTQMAFLTKSKAREVFHIIYFITKVSYYYLKCLHPKFETLYYLLQSKFLTILLPLLMTGKKICKNKAQFNTRKRKLLT